MAELPEVETIRRDMDKEVSGKRIKSVDFPGRKDVAPHTPNRKHFGTQLEGVKLGSVSRKGMLLVTKLDSDEILVIDLSRGGQIRKTATKDDVVKGTQVILTFTQGGQLRFLDASGGLTLEVMAPGDLAERHPELASGGADPLDEPISWTKFGEQLLRRQLKLKALLMEPTVLSGIGPVYSDEILFAAGLRHDRHSEQLSTQEMRRLYRSVVEVVHTAAKRRGTTLADGLFTDLHGRPGDYTAELRVYERDGEACLRCRKIITKGKAGGKVTYFCPDCQV